MRPTQTGTRIGQEEEAATGRKSGMQRLGRREGQEESSGGARDTGEQRMDGDSDEAGAGEKEADTANDSAGGDGVSVKGKKRKGGRTGSARAKRGRVAEGGGQQDVRRVRYVGDRSGRGRVPLAQAVVVGRVSVIRMMVRGTGRTDAGRPDPEPG